MMDEATIARIQKLRDKEMVIKKYDQEQTLKGFYEQVREEKVKQNKLKRSIKITVISFIILMTLMVANLQTLSSWEQKAMKWFLQYPNSFENPFNIKQ